MSVRGPLPLFELRMSCLAVSVFLVRLFVSVRRVPCRRRCRVGVRVRRRRCSVVVRRRVLWMVRRRLG